MFLIEARRLVIEMSVTDFAGTTSWCEAFMRRNGLCMHTKTTISQKLLREYKRKIIEFHKYVINMRKTLCFDIGQLGNMDEVSLTFDVPSNKTVDVKGAKTTMIETSGNEKTRYSVVLVCCADGTKLPPLLIFKRKTLPKDVIPHGIANHQMFHSPSPKIFTSRPQSFVMLSSSTDIIESFGNHYSLNMLSFNAI